MELTLERPELAILVLHMNLMRKSIRKGFKANYGHSEGRSMLNVFDGLKTLFENELTDDLGDICFNLEEPQNVMLQSFMNWYVVEVKLSAEIKGENIEQNEQISILESINNKVNMIVNLIQEERA